jgi:deazaflavin-dependent oxidoreductase (nitroreductase family)
MEPIFDSPIEWVAKHAQAYAASGGVEGGRLYDNDVLLITTRGRRSGVLRRTPLIFGRDRGRYVVIASYRGRPENPCWFLNLVANPEVTLQVGAEVFPAKASLAPDTERQSLWDMMSKLYPNFNDYQRLTLRRFPVVTIEPS